jgi:hypothetical protein
MPFAETKSIFESKTFWVNFLTTAAGVITYLAGEAWIKEIPGGEATLLVVLGVVNVALRFITVDAVKIFAVLLAVGLALSASPAEARPVRVCDGTACKVTAEPTINLSPAQARLFRAMPLPWVERNFVRALFGR